jgi:hypothetical protein
LYYSQTPPYDDDEPEYPAPEYTVPGREHTAPYAGRPSVTIRPPAPRKTPWLAIGAYLIGLLGVVLGVTCFALLLSLKGSTGTQLHAMRQALDSARSASASLNASVNSLNGKLAAIQNAVAVQAQFSSVCTQDLTGQNGQPAAFLFPCEQKP